MNKVKDKLPALVDEELAAAMEEHPLFASVHEGYAVTLEEVEEAEVELRSVRHHLCMLWNGAKIDYPNGVIHAAINLQEAAVNLAAEAIQVAAMAKKILDGMDPKKVAVMTQAVLSALGTEKVTP